MSEPVAPLVNDLNRPFRDAAAKGRLVLPWRDGAFAWPPAPTREDGGAEWRDAPAAGTLTSRAIYRRPFQQAFSGLMPYGIGEVALDAGVRLKAHLPAPDDAASPRSGDRVRLVFRSIVEGGPAVPVIVREDAS
jgi:uncharacterized OB-fold protein